MNYKDSIIEMVGTMENEEYLKKIFHFVEVPYRKEQEEKRMQNRSGKDGL